MYEDVLPIGSFLSYQIKSEKIKTVMIQHGYASKKSYFYESNDCDFYFLYDINRIRPFASRDKCIEIGLPIEAKISKKFKKNIVLVGTGLAGVNQSEYLNSLFSYKRIFDLLGRDFNVLYRPHPCEKLKDYVHFGFNIEKANKEFLLSEDLKVFIGYESTLLYEAKCLGHVCVYLVKNGVVDIDYEVDLFLDEANLIVINSFLSKIDIYNKFDTFKILPAHSLKNRFLNGIELIS